MLNHFIAWASRYQNFVDCCCNVNRDDPPVPGVKLSARPLALVTISSVWAHEIIRAFAHLATVNFNIIVM